MMPENRKGVGEPLNNPTEFSHVSCLQIPKDVIFKSLCIAAVDKYGLLVLRFAREVLEELLEAIPGGGHGLHRDPSPIFGKSAFLLEIPWTRGRFLINVTDRNDVGHEPGPGFILSSGWLLELLLAILIPK